MNIYTGRQSIFLGFTCISSMVDGKIRYHPWAHPGMAPPAGEGCGASGGNPNGCQAGNPDTSPYGTY